MVGRTRMPLDRGGEMETTLERWEDDEFIICINGKPFGGTVYKKQGMVILTWLKGCPEIKN